MGETLLDYLTTKATRLVDAQRPELQGEQREAEIVLVRDMLLEIHLP